MSKAEQARTPGTASEWRQRKLARRLRDENPRRNRTLKAATAFEDERTTGARRAECGIERQVDELGRNSRTVERRIASSCAGWRHGPSAAEFCDAVRAEGPTRRQMSLIAMRVRGASDEELLLAWADEVYSDRMLVAAIHGRSGRCQPATQRGTEPLGERTMTEDDTVEGLHRVASIEEGLERLVDEGRVEALCIERERDEPAAQLETERSG